MQHGKMHHMAHEGRADRPLVSVVMPAYNAARYIREAIDSVLSQDYPNLELIVVDDGSTDSTVAIVGEYGQRVICLSQANAGPAQARNTAVALAKGDLIAFLDADDVWMPGKVGAQVDYLHKHPDVDAVFGRFARWEADADGRFETPPASIQAGAIDGDRLARPSGYIYCDLLLDSVVHIITAMVRRELVRDLGGFDATLRTGEDYDFWLRAARRSRIDQLDHVLAWYRIHPASITQAPGGENGEYRVLLAALSRHGSADGHGRTVPDDVLQRRLAGICFGHGYLHFWRGSALQARRDFGRCLGHWHWQPRVAVYWVLSAFRSFWIKA